MNFVRHTGHTKRPVSSCSTRNLRLGPSLPGANNLHAIKRREYATKPNKAWILRQIAKYEMGCDRCLCSQWVIPPSSSLYLARILHLKNLSLGLGFSLSWPRFCFLAHFTKKGTHTGTHTRARIYTIHLMWACMLTLIGIMSQARNYNVSTKYFSCTQILPQGAFVYLCAPEEGGSGFACVFVCLISDFMSLTMVSVVTSWYVASMFANEWFLTFSDLRLTNGSAHKCRNILRENAFVKCCVACVCERETILAKSQCSYTKVEAELTQSFAWNCFCNRRCLLFGGIFCLPGLDCLQNVFWNLVGSGHGRPKDGPIARHFTNTAVFGKRNSVRSISTQTKNTETLFDHGEQPRNPGSQQPKKKM